MRGAQAAPRSVYAAEGLAINGYDPVDCLTEDNPIKGDSALNSDWNEVALHHASARNKAIFDSAPETYAPRDSGYHAYAVPKGAIAPTDPEAWTA